MELSNIIFAIIGIGLIALIPALHFTNETKQIEKKLYKEESKEKDFKEIIYNMQIEISNIRKIFKIFLIIVLIGLTIKIFILTSAIDKISNVTNNFENIITKLR